MKNVLLLLCLFALSPRLPTAQDAKTPVAPEKVTYSRAIPKSLFAFLPPGGKSRFWGATKLQFEGKPVWVHVYDAQKVSANGYLARRLDLFVFPKSHKLLRVSSTRFEVVKNPGETLGLETLYLDSRKRERPIIKIAFQCSGLLGPITDYMFVVFNQNLQDAVVQHQFGKGDTNGSGWSSYNISFGVDEKGLLIVRYYQGGTMGERITTYEWKENLFRPTKRIERQGMDGDNPYLAVPLTDD